MARLSITLRAMRGPSSPSPAQHSRSQLFCAFCARFKHCAGGAMKPLSIFAFLICSTAFASAPELLIPAAGSTPGVNGTFFRSDITIGNFATHDQIVRLRWLPQGVSSTFSMTMTLRGRSGVRSEDFVTEILGQSGLGAILITGVTSSGGLDPTADLY